MDEGHVVLLGVRRPPRLYRRQRELGRARRIVPDEPLVSGGDEEIAYRERRVGSGRAGDDGRHAGHGRRLQAVALRGRGRQGAVDRETELFPVSTGLRQHVGV
jgi:hypothetical protein